ncbi:hypothetical protein ACVW1B_004243 [Bradyrhizobium sp. USDA 4502]
MLPNKPRGVRRANDRRVLNGIFVRNFGILEECPWVARRVKSPGRTPAERPEETVLGGMDAAQHDHESHFAIAVLAASILAFTESRLKLAPFCIGGNSIAVMASFSTSC